MTKDIGPRDFLEAIFSDRPEPLQVAITQQHLVATKLVYPSYPWPTANVLEFHTHFAPSYLQPYMPDVKGFKRRNKAWVAGKAVILDDIGETKPVKDPTTGEVVGEYTIPVPKLQPTYRMETKPGSEQWGYVFPEPLFDASAYMTILKSCHEAGITDKHGSVNMIRLARLPWSQPIGKKHRAELVEWNPERRFDPKTLIRRLDIPTVKVGAKNRKPVPAAPGASVGPDPLLQWMTERGMVREFVAPWYRIQCPWHHGHTETEADDAYYKPPTNDDILRAFNCYHSACNGRRTFVLANWAYAQGGPLVDRMDMDAVFTAEAREQFRKAVGAASIPSHILEDAHDEK